MDETAKMHWYILGAGSLGCLWGAYWALAGRGVTLLLRDQKRLADFAGSILLETGGCERRASVTAQLATAPGPTIGYLLVTVKAQDTLSALACVQGRLSHRTRVVLLQNGMGVLEEIAERFADLTVLPASTTHGAYRSAAFQVVHAGFGETWLGDGLVAVDAADRDLMLAGLSASGLVVQYDDDIRTRLWNKLAINCVINPLTALLQCTNGELLRHPEGRPLLRRICAETAVAMQALGLSQTTETLFDRVHSVAEATAENYSSMCQDLCRGAPTEIAYINGYLLRRAQERGLELPLNRLLFDLVTLRQRWPAFRG